MRSRFARYLAGSNGNAAAEFALVVPAFVLLIFAMVNLSLMGYAALTLHWDVEAAARCAAVSQRYSSTPTNDPSASCQTIALIKSYAQGIYRGPMGLALANINPQLDSTNKCMKVTATGSYKINAGIASASVPLTATACFPTTATTLS